MTALAASMMMAGVPLGHQFAQEETASQTSQDTTYLRVVHASPDAPAVDVLVDGSELLGDVSFGEASDYLELSAGTYNVTITAADDPDTVVFDDEVTLEARSATTLAASGEISEGAATSFEPVAFSDDALAVGDEEAAVRVVHLSPDAPAVDVTVGEGEEMVVLADNLSYQEASSYMTVPAGDYTVDIRAATADNDGEIVTSVDVSAEGGTVYSGMAVGYLDASAAPAETPFEVLLTEDAQTTIAVPSEEMAGTATPAGNETEVGTATETGMGTETDTGMGTETGTEMGTPIGTETGTEIGTETGTEFGTETENETETATP